MERDKATLMKCPTIDREDNNGNYEHGNCRFIEKSLNSKKDRYVSINQYDLNGKFIKKWNSIDEVVETLRLCQSSLSRCINDKRNKCGNFTWRRNEILIN